MPQPAIALLYTTCNDFVEESVESCVRQHYNNYKVYILDDSSQQSFKDQVDAFAAEYPDRVTVVRRPDRKGFKAGNMNYGLANHAINEPYFAIADADEILPTDFPEQNCCHYGIGSHLWFCAGQSPGQPQ
ncbi:MAG: glycosyltransferase [Saprospiraceae bacterium]